MDVNIVGRGDGQGIGANTKNTAGRQSFRDADGVERNRRAGIHLRTNTYRIDAQSLAGGDVRTRTGCEQTVRTVTKCVDGSSGQHDCTAIQREAAERATSVRDNTDTGGRDGRADAVRA